VARSLRKLCDRSSRLHGVPCSLANDKGLTTNDGFLKTVD
jgi:hypothetical protein